MPIIEVPGYGQVEFPDNMTDAEIAAAIKRSYFNDRLTPQKLEAAEQQASRQQMTHPIPKQSPRDAFTKTAQDQSFFQNVLSGTGGVLKGLGYVGPRSLFGLDKPGEVQEWKDSMAGLSNTTGGTIGQVLGYATPAAAVAPFVGASVPVAAAVGAVEGALMPAETMKERGFNVATSAGGASLGQAGGNKLATMAGKRLARKTTEKATEQARNIVRDETMRTGRSAGYILPPSATGRESFLESLGGQIKTQQASAWKNQQVTNDLARKAMGLPENAPLTSDAMRAIRTDAGKAYSDIASLSPEYAGAVEGLKQARYEARNALSNARMTGNPETMAAYRDAKSIADKLEQGLDQALKADGKSDLLDKFVNARKRIAMSYDVQDNIVDSTGDVVTRGMAKAYDEGQKGFGPRLTGELETIGRFGQAFPQQTAWRSFAPLPNSALDGMTASVAIGAGQGHPAALMAGALPYTRNPVRNFILREATQNKMMNPQYKVPLNAPLLKGLLDNRVSSALYPALGVAPVTNVYGDWMQPQIQQ